MVDSSQVFFSYADVAGANPEWTERMVDDYMAMKRDIGATLQNLIPVLVLADFPIPDNGIITLRPNTSYLIGAQVNILLNRIVYTSGSEIRGLNTSISGLISATTGPLLECLDLTFRVSGVLLTNPNGSLFNFRGGPTFAVVIEKILAFSYASLGTMNNVNAGIVTISGFFGVAPGFLFTGTGSVSAMLFRDTLFDGYTGVAVDMGVALFESFQMISCNFNSTVGTVALSGLPNSANVNIRGLVSGTVFNGDGGALGGGLTTKDLKWRYGGNFNVQDSVAAVGMAVLASSEVTSISVGDGDLGNPKKVNMGILAVAINPSRFTVDPSGTMTYIGLEDVCETVAYGAFGDNSLGNNKTFAFYVAINGVFIPGSKATASFDNTNPQNIGICHALVELKTNDTVDLFIENRTDETDMNVIDVSVTID